ncbi:MAG: hypothetical protein HZA32_18780 [Opitutae bacterium]|nr:hypothetical protein [Opitutae bacterium]
MLTGIFLGAVALAILAAVRPLVRVAQWRWQDAALAALLIPIALYSVRPYVSASAIGAGDSHHYALQVADFVAQERAGVRPILVGGSDYQFNGGVHTVRTAPYFTHLAGLIDLATFRRLSAVQLQNLVVAATAILAALAAYAAALHASGRRRAVAWLLAAIYVLSPAIYGPLTLMDMFATYMAAPALVLGWFALLAIVERTDNTGAHVLAAGAVGFIWYAHSPIAVWFSLLWGFAIAAECVRPGRLRQTWRAILLGGLLFAAMAAYVWVSLATLDVAPTPTINPPFAEFSWSVWRAVIAEALRPYATGQPFALQFGLPLWLLLAAGVAILAVQRRAAAGFALPIALVLLLLFPWPHLAESLWRALPSPLVAQMTWPGQRFYPLLGSAAVVLGAFSLRDTKVRWLTHALLAAAVGWSAWQISLLHARPGVAVIAPAVHRQMFSPNNLTLSRYSYAFFGQIPPYFTNGWTDPEFELRIVDATGQTVADNTQAALVAAGSGEFASITIESFITLEGRRDYLIEFAFSAPDLTGEVVVQAPGVRRAFTLPSNGEPRAFGAGPAATKATPLRLTGAGPQQVNVSSIRPGVSYRVLPFDHAALPIQMLGNMPLHARVRTPKVGFLETPRMWIDGYAARVDGRFVPVQKSTHGLVQVPVPAGEVDVVLTYPGPLALRAAWYLSLTSLAVLPWLLLRAARRTGR